ncbi:N-(5'-phosphoribosyl)anthranilate isomerase [Litorimonas cladophorae]|uniref:N-(5'-phosphoribosyl)anthranilate isomerase n=1 Tax=Litorimonas cladophorae TaxID=1220491 RepID=A0A918NH31_9PROT|nr:phosphoribosylanthranilate isomerase [Litorimonas cladophorae]GGX72590.1 N-(5'-phosphoribosyl)anthranilate isomerase [Litorimonas cladophorae]
MNTLVKICGLTRKDDVSCALDNGAAFLGFIIECPSKRRLSVAQAAAIAPATLAAQRVAVTVNPDDALLARIMDEMTPDYIQLHGDETPARTAEIARNFKVKIIKAVGIASDDDMKDAEAYAGVADFILYDAKPPKGEKVRGGHGIAIDWNVIARAPTPKTFAVAGGLNPENVAEAMTATRAPIVDVSSGVELSAGVKDAQKITAFMDAVRNG